MRDLTPDIKERIAHIDDRLRILAEEVSRLRQQRSLWMNLLRNESGEGSSNENGDWIPLFNQSQVKPGLRMRRFGRKTIDAVVTEVVPVGKNKSVVFADGYRCPLHNMKIQGWQIYKGPAAVEARE